VKVRTVLFDLYATLLEVGPPPADADIRWPRLFREMLGIEPPLGRLEFFAACSQVVARHHDLARQQGVPWPEVQWTSIVKEVLPDLARLSSESVVGEFVLRQMQTTRTVELPATTAALLRWLQARGVLLGIVSNAQAYTWQELDDALAAHGLDRRVFERELCVLSFEHGFSKPDPHSFRILTARLEARGIPPASILMVGDRLDNDIEPARACGWQTWHRTGSPDTAWADLRNWLQETASHTAV
jgi:FMN phosphatase YigB (HAD superfamily)